MGVGVGGGGLGVGGNIDIVFNTTIFIKQRSLCVNRAPCFDLNWVIFRLLTFRICQFVEEPQDDIIQGETC